MQLNDSDITAIPIGYRILSGWFQAVSTRTAGLAVVNIAELHPAMQVSYMGKLLLDSGEPFAHTQKL